MKASHAILSPANKNNLYIILIWYEDCKSLDYLLTSPAAVFSLQRNNDNTFDFRIFNLY